MTRKDKPQHRRFRLKLAGYAAAALLSGILLIILSQAVKPDDSATEGTPTTSAPATAPADPDAPNRPESDPSMATSLHGLLLLFSMACFLIVVICAGWIVVDIRNARPAWQREQKYPQKR